MLLLALETTTTRGGVAVTKDGKLLSAIRWEKGKSHSELLTPAIQKVVEDSGIHLTNLDLIAVDRGPGSFTGIRVSINAARALGFSLQKRILVCDSLSVLAHSVISPQLPVISLLNAHKNLLYVRIFSAGKLVPTMEPTVMSVDALEKLVLSPHLCVGEGYGVYEKFMSAQLRSHLRRDPNCDDLPQVETLAHLASNPLFSHSTLAWNEVIPLYLRGINADEKLKGQV